MGIQVLQTPAGSNEAPGPLNLPPSFNRKKHAAKWVKEGPAVRAAAEREYLHGTNLTADGWEVWKDEEGKPHKVALQSGTHVLLCRSREVQDGVNAICGNVGKQRLSQERTGETIAGQIPTDPGLLSDDKLQKVIGKEEDSEGDVKMNPVPGVSNQRVETSTLQTVSTRRRLPRRESQ